MGCIAFLLIGTIAAVWAGIDISEEGPDVKNIVMFIAGIAVVIFGWHCIAKASDYYHEKESTKTEIITSVPAQMDTIITIRNSIPDTAYIYKFNLTENKQQ